MSTAWHRGWTTPGQRGGAANERAPIRSAWNLRAGALGELVGLAPSARSAVEDGEAHALGLDGCVKDLVIEELGRGFVDKDCGARLVDRLVRRFWLVGERYLDGGVGTASPRG
jgi:hypothetical protein